ncbi:kinase-like domain-containing protein [Armillaria borealis]|uniref:Kinase-like domain-containing protein n=1 Tax=Armillaria borealis TaxID=47425 RepID=A0AA39JBA7_9AGAR|nr:kinase-like domain-containing protein [Armillaria borealis]
MSIPDAERPTLSKSTTSSTGPFLRTLNDWTDITLDDGLAENEARAQVQSLVRGIRLPWKTVKLTPQPVETMVMDVLQQELDDASYPDEYRTACMKCLRALSKARGIVPSSLFLLDTTREGENPVTGGGFADIWKGRLRDKQVCLKVLRVFGTEDEKVKVLREFCQEALVWRQLRHLNVLPFLGVSKELFAPRYCLISPWIVNGNLMSYLEAHPDHDRLTSLVQIAEGMKYLHSLDPPIVHADIRGANILVMDDLRCCLADFGLSLFAESQTLNSSSRMSKGSTRWLAPEYIDPDAVIDRAYVTARDIYAYGSTVVEIFTGEPPFGYIKNEPAVMLAVIAGRRPLRPQHLLQDGLWSLVMACLTASPSERPNAERISKVLAEGFLFVDSFSFSDGIFEHARRSLILSESATFSTGPLDRTLNSWTQIKLDDGRSEYVARAQIRSQVQSLIRDIPFPWMTVELTPQQVETVVMDALQQELDDPSCPDGYRTACTKCLRTLCKARNAVPSSLFLRDVTREEENPVGSGGFADIWRGRLHDTQVCLKVLRVFCPEEDQAKVLREICQEALVWRQLRHPNVLPFLGPILITTVLRRWFKLSKG